MGGAHHYSGSPVSEMTYTVSSGTLNPSIPYHSSLFALASDGGELGNRSHLAAHGLRSFSSDVSKRNNGHKTSRGANISPELGAADDNGVDVPANEEPARRD